MGMWIEIRCETALVEGYTRCWSRRNEWPGEMADDATVAIIDTLRHISKRAKN